MTELWDTELIGEGALPTLRDACNRLLEVGKACISLLSIYIELLVSYNQALSLQLYRDFNIPRLGTSIN